MKLSSLQQYSVVTANYWAFTLTDGALRILVVGHFHELGYSTLQIALLFLFYEFFGIITNLFGGWIGARYGVETYFMDRNDSANSCSFHADSSQRELVGSL